jgi:hypothetical protein
MLQKVYEAGGGIDAATKTPVICAGGLAAWVKAEYEVFRLFAKHMVNICHEYAEVNPFAQGQQD